MIPEKLLEERSHIMRGGANFIEVDITLAVITFGPYCFDARSSSSFAEKTFFFETWFGWNRDKQRRGKGYDNNPSFRSLDRRLSVGAHKD